ncbi:MAG TPA: electron transfer flavoprotein-ubiquinone oxidoreductase, partial [Pyrodictium sp.]|nr:electron transfer flavoprotein-ubiquinone oxidoreductase [Pyrodictium sp.]
QCAGMVGSEMRQIMANSTPMLGTERGRGAGSKSLFGGKVYAQPLRDVWPDLDRKAPIHRWVTRERFSFIAGERVVTIEAKLGRSVAFTTYLPELVRWMAGRAEEAGALLVDEVVVDNILVKDGKVVGVKSGGDVLEANVVIDAEGVNRLLLEKLGLADPPDPRRLALGVKEIIRLGDRAVEERFGLEKGEGLAWLLAGDVSKGIPGGGFIYTMKDAASVGIVLRVSDAASAAEGGALKEHVSRMVEWLRLHPYFKRYWEEGDIAEYGARLAIEGGLGYVPKRLYWNGLLVVGDAAGLLLNTGYTIRGVDFAVASGKMAAETVLEAHARGNYSEAVLSAYETRLKSSFVWKELVKHRGIEDVMSDTWFFKALPAIIAKTVAKLFEADYEEPTMLEAIKEALEEEGTPLLLAAAKLLKAASQL